MLRLLARLVLAAIGGAMLVTAVFAHATLLDSDPTEGSVAARPPGEVRLSFNEPVTPLAVKLFAPDGRDTEVTATARDNDVLVTLPADAGAGTYALSWRVASADGHPIGGTMTFSIGHTSSRAAIAPEASAIAPLLWLARIGVYIGWIGGVGGAFFLIVVAGGQRPAVADRAVLGLIGVSAVASVLSFGLQGLDEFGKGLGDLGSAAVWLAGLKSGYGATLVTGAVALALAAVALRLPASRLAAGTASLALLTVAAALTLSGHASTAAPAWAARPALALHGAAAVLWGGSLLPLLILVSTRQPQAGQIAQRLSGLLLPTVALLVLSGLTLAFLQGVTVASLTGTAYGRLLGGKLLLVLAMLGIGALNRRILVPKAATGAGVALGRVLMVDVCLLLAVLAVVAGWRFTPPPRSLAAAAAAAVSHRHATMLHIQTARGMAMVEFSGHDGLDIWLTGADGRVLTAREVRLSLANPAAGLEPMRRQATPASLGRWHVDGLTFPFGGAWDLRLDVLISDFDSLSFEGKLAVP